MADGASQAELRSERRWRRRILLSGQNPPLPPSKRRRIGARKSSPPHPVVVIDLEDDDSVPDSKKIDVSESSVPGNDGRQNQTLHDGDDLPEQNSIDELTRRDRKRTLDADARDARVSQGNGLTIECEMIANETRKCFDVVREKNGRFNNDVDGNANDTCFSYGDGLGRNCEVPVNVLEGGSNMDLDYKFFLDNLGEEDKCRDLKIDMGDKAMPLVFDHEISSRIEKEKMGSRDVEGPCGSRRNRLDAMEERNARLDHNGDAEANYAERHNSMVSEDKNTKSIKGKSSEVMEGMDSRLGRDGDRAKGNCVSDEDGDVGVYFIADCNATTKGGDDAKDRCVSNADGAKDNDAKQHCASGDDDVEFLHVSDTGDVNYYSLSDDDDTNNSHDLDSDGMVDECYKIFLRCLKPDGCVSNADGAKDNDAKQNCASGDDDVEFLHVLDTGDVNYYSLSNDDDTSNSHDLDSDDMVDECYKIFLRCLKPDGEIADFLDFKGEMKRYGAKSNKEERPGLKTPFNSFTPRNNGDRTLTSIVTKQTKFADKLKFREELINVLKRPYNQNEYEKLWKEISIRRPIELQRELRGKTKRYPVDRVGKSYLDHHPDLASTIASMKKDKQRVLNQLRGFFYWLENLSHQGSCVPWKDPVCLQVLPKT